MASERDFELLDDYLANRLSGDEKVAFERRMEGDPEMKREFTVQQNIVEGIKRARLAELKGMLQNTPVPAPSVGQTMLAKVGMIAVVAGLIATGVWFFTKEEQEIKQEAAPIAEKSPDATKQEPVTEELTEEPAKQEEVVVEEKAAARKEETKAASKKNKKSPATKENESPVKPQPEDPTAEELQADERAVEPTPASLEKKAKRVGSAIVIEPVLDNKKYNFHYQFDDGKLLVYGEAFRDGAKPLILEFFENNKRTNIFLFHANNYYQLNEGNTEVTVLKAVKDPSLIKALDDYRNQN